MDEKKIHGEDRTPSTSPPELLSAELCASFGMYFPLDHIYQAEMSDFFRRNKSEDK